MFCDNYYWQPTWNVIWGYPIRLPNHARREFKRAIAETNAMILAIIPKTNGIAESAPFVAASKKLESFLKKKVFWNNLFIFDLIYTTDQTNLVWLLKKINLF